MTGFRKELIAPTVAAFAGFTAFAAVVAHSRCQHMVNIPANIAEVWSAFVRSRADDPTPRFFEAFHFDDNERSANERVRPKFQVVVFEEVLANDLDR